MGQKFIFVPGQTRLGLIGSEPRLDLNGSGPALRIRNSGLIKFRARLYNYSALPAGLAHVPRTVLCRRTRNAPRLAAPALYSLGAASVFVFLQEGRNTIALNVGY